MGNGQVLKFNIVHGPGGLGVQAKLMSYQVKYWGQILHTSLPQGDIQEDQILETAIACLEAIEKT